jgi:hypothetical protein
MGVGSQVHAPAALPPRKRSGIYCIGDWVGLRAGLKGAENLALTGIRFPDQQPVASVYSDYAIPAQE